MAPVVAITRRLLNLIEDHSRDVADARKVLEEELIVAEDLADQEMDLGVPHH